VNCFAAPKVITLSGLWGQRSGVSACLQPPVLIGERCAAFPETFAPLVDVASGLHTSALAHQVKALTLLWLRSALSSQKLPACVQAVQALSRVRAAYAHNAPILGARALEMARRATASVSSAAAKRLAPRPQEVIRLEKLSGAMVQGDWGGDVADELVALQTCWHDDADNDVSLVGARPDEAPVAIWLRNLGDQASAVTQSLQNRWTLSKRGHSSGSRDGVSDGHSTRESADGAVASGDGPWREDDGLTESSMNNSGYGPVEGGLVNVKAEGTGGGMPRPNGLRRVCECGAYSHHDCSLLLEQVRTSSSIVAISTLARFTSDGCNQDSLYAPVFHHDHCLLLIALNLLDVDAVSIGP
jgi:hypothetical protein